ncbi:MAG: M48 family metallopeptidase [Epsilonproteobacteria bacterium]|nr:M48 family metallopeptidase [Campylobacterota bacterium]
MLEVFIALFSIYTALKVYISVMQIGFIISKRDKEPVLMEKDEFRAAANYAIEKEKISLFSHFLEYLLFLWWVIFGFGFLYEISSDMLDTPFKQSLLFMAGYFAIDYILTLPISIYQTFIVDKKYGFTQTTPKIFLIDQIKSISLFLTLGLGIISLLIWIVNSFELWWFYAFIFAIALILLINFIYPTVIAPIFNKFSPLADQELRIKIEALMERSGMKANGIFVMDASKRDSRLNAYFGGVGRSKRVVLFDTLLEKLNHNELLAVLGHELGHFKHGDIWKNIILMTILMFIIFFMLGNLPENIFSQMHTAPIAGVKLTFMVMILPLVTFVWMPIISFFSRKHEYKADEYGSSMSSKDNLSSALLKLVKENRSFPSSHPIYIFFYYSHPPILERLKALGYNENKGNDDKFRITDFIKQ